MPTNFTSTHDRPRPAANAYHFVTHWSFDADVEDVKRVLQEPLDLPRWWPAVYLDARELRPAQHEDGRGRRVELYTKGWLPYTLRWHFEVTEVRGDRFVLTAGGDLEGRGEWFFAQRRGRAFVSYDWRVLAEKPLLRRWSWALEPAFRANHHWAMATGEESLRIELARLAAKTDAERRALKSPPRATFAWALPSGR